MKQIEQIQQVAQILDELVFFFSLEAGFGSLGSLFVFFSLKADLESVRLVSFSLEGVLKRGLLLEERVREN